MNLQNRKLSLIEGLLGVTDAEILLRVDAFLKREISQAREQEMVPMSMQAYHEMIDRSLEDVRNGKILDHEALKKEIGTWTEK